MRVLRFAIIIALLAWPSISSAQRAYWTQQQDVNGNCLGDGTLELICFTETVAAVNEITITNQVTGVAPRIASSGEANIGLELSSQGAGGVVTILGTLLDIPDAAAPATTARGHMAVDQGAWVGPRDAIEFFDNVASTYLIGALVSDPPANGEVPKWNTGGTITWEPDATAGAPTWDSILDPTTAQTLNMDLDVTTFNWVDTADTTIDAFTLTFDESNVANVNNQRLLVLRRISGGVGEEMDSLLVIDNADVDDVVTNGIEMTAAAGLITNAINIGANITNVFLTPNDTLSLADVEVVATTIAGGRTDEALCTYEGTENELDCDLGVTRGSIVIGDATPVWTELVVGGANLVHLMNDATDVFWANSDTAAFIIEGTVVPAVSGGVVIDTNADNSNIVDAVLMFQSGAVDYHVPSMRAFPIAQVDVLSIDTTANRFAYKSIVGTAPITVTGGDTSITVAINASEVEVHLDEMFLLIPVTAGPQAELVGANFVQEVLAFNDGTLEEVFIRFPIDAAYVDTAIVCTWYWEGTNIINEVRWCMDGASAGNGETRDPADDPTGVCVDDTASGTTLFLNTVVITLTPGVNYTAGDTFYARLFRDAANVADDFVGDARLTTGSCAYDVTL
ncbi:MAG: hypothetical protein V3R16_02445 [Nitrospirales bacterium]